jgi:hypothetical protein
MNMHAPTYLMQIKPPNIDAGSKQLEIYKGP